MFVTAVVTPLDAGAQCTADANGLRCFGTDLNGALTNSNAARTGFLASLSGVGTENFEALSGSSPFVLTFPGAGTATLQGGGDIQTSPGAGRFATSGTRYLEATSAAGGGSTFSIAFGSTVAAFGFYGTDIGDFLSQLTLRFTLAGGGTVDWLLPYTGSSTRNNSALYAGFIDTRGFTSVQFIGTDDDDVFGFDDMTIGSLQQVTPPGTVVPEPGTFALVTVGLIGAFVARRRRA